MINSQTTQSITLDFNSSDFYYNSYDGYIESTTNDIIYEEDTNLPAIPFFPVRVKLPMGYTYSHVTYTSQRKVFANNVVHDSEEVQNIYGEKYRLKAHDKQITDWILFMGDFSNSYTYLQNLCNKLFFNSNATQLFTYVREKNKDVLMYQVVSEA